MIDDDDFLKVFVAVNAVAQFLDAGTGALGGEAAVEHIVDESGFSGAAYAGYDGQHAERDHQIHILQIVEGRAGNTEKFPDGLVPGAGNGDAHFAAEVAASDGFRVAQHFGVGARKEQPAAEFAGTGAEIEDVVGGGDGVRVVLDDEDGVAEIAQGFQDVDEALGVSRMKADGWFIENVERADEMRPERSGKLDALRFAARKCGGEAIEGQVVKTDFIEELQASADLFQDSFGDFALRFGEDQRGEEFPRFLDGELAEIGDGVAGNAHGAGFGAQARAIAFGAGGVAAVTAKENADVELVFFAFQPSFPDRLQEPDGAARR